MSPVGRADVDHVRAGIQAGALRPLVLWGPSSDSTLVPSGPGLGIPARAQ
jgi:hypothetical protein